MDMTKMVEDLSKAKQELEAAKARKSGVVLAKEKIKNQLFNYYEPLIQAVVDNSTLREENDMLETSLADADKENDGLRDRIAELEEQLASVQNSRKRKTPASDMTEV